LILDRDFDQELFSFRLDVWFRVSLNQISRDNRDVKSFVSFKIDTHWINVSVIWSSITSATSLLDQHILLFLDVQLFRIFFWFVSCFHSIHWLDVYRFELRVETLVRWFILFWTSILIYSARDKQFNIVFLINLFAIFLLVLVVWSRIFVVQIILLIFYFFCHLEHCFHVDVMFIHECVDEMRAHDDSELIHAICIRHLCSFSKFEDSMIKFVNDFDVFHRDDQQFFFNGFFELMQSHVIFDFCEEIFHR
jgi:hypothetical protein